MVVTGPGTRSVIRTPARSRRAVEAAGITGLGGRIVLIGVGAFAGPPGTEVVSEDERRHP
ncbi:MULTISPECIES: hypothetical protein [unclassified Streptomyces]|uniref:hypothetical protein n=1 Tax=unclassified Streptomyces TaxID=2593676 RepID=UPI0035DA912A